MSTPSSRDRPACVSIADLNCEDIVVEEADVRQLLCGLLAARALAKKRGLSLVCHLLDMAMVEALERAEASVDGPVVKQAEEAA
jgi:hypothetical protein